MAWVTEPWPPESPKLPSFNQRIVLAENGLTGTKLGCGEGGCGACTVMVSAWDGETKHVLHRSVNACLCPLYAVEGMQVVTVEGEHVG